MITTLDITGFKSIKGPLHLDCRRVNVFIGEPDTGKSNILEVLAFLSYCGHGGNAGEYLRARDGYDLVYDRVAGPWEIEIDTTPGPPRVQVEAHFPHVFMVDFENNRSAGTGTSMSERVNVGDLKLTSPFSALSFIRFYRFADLDQFPSQTPGALEPPRGRNLVKVLTDSKPLRQQARDFFSPSNRMFVIKPHEGEIEFQKQEEGLAIALPYYLSSDTMRRMVFYMAAIESNQDATLIFEEPEAHAFPYYTKHLGERIAMDENRNQYFLATHNPYLLSAIWEKSKPEDLAVFATYKRDDETRVKALTADELTGLFDADPFLGVSHLVEQEP